MRRLRPVFWCVIVMLMVLGLGCRDSRRSDVAGLPKTPGEGKAVAPVSSVKAAEPLSPVVPQKPKQLPPATVAAKKTTDKIVIDGKLDEQTWQQAQRLPIEFIHNTGTKTTAGGFGRMAWDDDSFYIAFELTDTDIQAQGDTRDNCNINPPNDVVEVFIDINNDDEHFIELHLNALNGFNDIFIVRPRKESPLYNRSPYHLFFLNGWNLADYQTAVQVSGTANNAQDQDKGWTAEIRLPFKSLMMPAGQQAAKPGDVWRVQLVDQNGGAKDRYLEWSPNYEAWFHHAISNWGRVEFAQ